MRNGVLLAACLALATPCHATQFWFAGEDAVTKLDKHRPGPQDWVTLFAPDAAWRKAASQVAVFKFSAQMVLRGRDEDLRAMYGWLRQHHIAVAVEMGSVLRSAECGGGEGYGPPGLIDHVAGRMQRLGLTLDDWTMDEPLWFAHEKTWGRNECAYPVAEVARRVGENVATMRHYFPSIRIGDAEVVAADRIPPAQLVGDYLEFARDFAQITGTRLAYFHADVSARGHGERAMPMLTAALRTAGIRTGIIFGGSPQDEDGQAWVAHGLERLRATLADPAIRPDDVVIQSWQPLPDHYLPETDPASATYFLLQAERLDH